MTNQKLEICKNYFPFSLFQRKIFEQICEITTLQLVEMIDPAVGN